MFGKNGKYSEVFLFSRNITVPFSQYYNATRWNSRLFRWEMKWNGRFHFKVVKWYTFIPHDYVRWSWNDVLFHLPENAHWFSTQMKGTRNNPTSRNILEYFLKTCRPLVLKYKYISLSWYLVTYTLKITKLLVFVFYKWYTVQTNKKKQCYHHLWINIGMLLPVYKAQLSRVV